MLQKSIDLGTCSSLKVLTKRCSGYLAYRVGKFDLYSQPCSHSQDKALPTKDLMEWAMSFGVQDCIWIRGPHHESVNHESRMCNTFYTMTRLAGVEIRLLISFGGTQSTKSGI